MVLVETTNPDCYRLAFRSLDVWRGAPTFKEFSHHFFSSPHVQGGSWQFHPLQTLCTVETGIPRSLEMALYPLEVLCLLIIALVMPSDSSFVFTIVTKEQGITDGFLKHWSHHLLANSCHMGTDNLSQVILIWFSTGESQCVSMLIYSKGCQYQWHSKLQVFLFSPPIVYCLSFALRLQTRVLYRKEIFHFIFFPKDIPHYVLKLGNNGEQDCMAQKHKQLIPTQSNACC